jgi:hypothetical protein
MSKYINDLRTNKNSVMGSRRGQKPRMTVLTMASNYLLDWTGLDWDSVGMHEKHAVAT